MFFYYLNPSDGYRPQTILSDIPSVYFIVPLIVLDILLIGTLYLSFVCAKRALTKEKDDITKNMPDL